MLSFLKCLICQNCFKTSFELSLFIEMILFKNRFLNLLNSFRYVFIFLDILINYAKLSKLSFLYNLFNSQKMSEIIKIHKSSHFLKCMSKMSQISQTFCKFFVIVEFL